MREVAAYLRVSSRSQDVASQRDAIERAAKARGDVVALWYAEHESAKGLHRPELARLRVDARAGKLAKLYVYRLDRLTRSGVRDTFVVVEELREHGCSVASVADGFDLDGKAADVVLAVLAWAAQMEREAIRERQSAARTAREAKGLGWGRPSRLSAFDVGRVRAKKAAGMSTREIAVAMSIPRSTVRRALGQNYQPKDGPAPRGETEGEAGGGP